ncbi:MAG TPA: segregation/condensation protein A [Phycisphaerales bacterium]|nr:segregation/condensation protein A [Phycisphaerales bacterium]
MLTDDYRVRLDAFEGPLDLLLFLIRKNEVDIHDIPVAAITEQYLAFLKDLGTSGSRIDIDIAGEFLVMAATLMELKSRMLMPRPPQPEGAADSESDPRKPTDPRAELVKQLLEYKKYRDAADHLEWRAEDWRRRFPVHPAGIDSHALRAAIEKTAEETDLEDLNLIDLVEAFQKIAESVNFERLGDHQVKYDDTPIEIHAADILTRLSSEPAPDTKPELELVSLFKGRTRSEMVGLFLALLELVRNRKVAVRQDRIEGHIYLRQRDAEETPTDPAPSDPDTP